MMRKENPMNENDKKRLRMFQEKLNDFSKKLENDPKLREKYRQMLLKGGTR